MATNTLFRIVRMLSVGGIILAIFLLWEQVAQPAIPPCEINSYINCNALISGAVAKTFGIPTPLYGLVGYVIILIASILHRGKMLLTTAIFGFMFCSYIAYQELFILHVICPICIACFTIMISVFVLTIMINYKLEMPKNR
jgi:uncharacterized membrane protein